MNYIKLDKELLESTVFTHESLWRVYSYCLLKASSGPQKVFVGLQQIELKEGQLVTNRRGLGITLGYTPSTVQKYLKMLKQIGLITLEATNKYTLITITDYEKFKLEN